MIKIARINKLITIDVDLNEMCKIKRAEDSSFSISNLINDFLRDYFGEEIKDLDKKKLRSERAELEQKLALLKAQEVAIDAEKERQEKDKIEKEFGKGHIVTEFDPFKEGFS